MAKYRFHLVNGDISEVIAVEDLPDDLAAQRHAMDLGVKLYVTGIDVEVVALAPQGALHRPAQSLTITMLLQTIPGDGGAAIELPEDVDADLPLQRLAEAWQIQPDPGTLGVETDSQVISDDLGRVRHPRPFATKSAGDMVAAYEASLYLGVVPTY